MTAAARSIFPMQDASRFFREVAEASKPGAKLLLAEPKGHVRESDFDSELQLASKAGLELVSRPTTGRSYAAELKKV